MSWDMKYTWLNGKFMPKEPIDPCFCRSLGMFCVPNNKRFSDEKKSNVKRKAVTRGKNLIQQKVNNRTQ